MLEKDLLLFCVACLNDWVFWLLCFDRIEKDLGVILFSFLAFVGLQKRAEKMLQ